MVLKNNKELTLLENKILYECNLIKINNRVYYAKNHPFVMSRNNLNLLKYIAKSRGLSVCRICLHINDDAEIHEMLIMHTKPYKFIPHSQNKSSLSYHILFGWGEMTLYNKDGKLTETVQIGVRDNDSQHIRLNPDVFRSIESLSESFIYLEVASGPFNDKDTIWLD